MRDIAEFLSEHDPFSELDPAELDRLAARAEVEFFAAGTTIFKQGERPQDKVHVVRRGTVELVDHGRVLDLLGEGELFGHPSMVSGLPTGFEARAHADSLCYALAAEDARPLLTGPSGARYLARSLLGRPKPGPVVAADVSGFDLAQQPCRALIRDQPLTCDPDVSLRDAAARMTEHGTTSILVRTDGSDELGIVTDLDLRSRVVAEGLSYDTPIGQVMTTPVVTTGTDANGADVLLAMLDHGIRHLPVVSAPGEVLGVISDLDLLAAETRTPFVLRRAITDAQDVEELRQAARRLNPTLSGLQQSELPPTQISAVISVVADALIRRAIELAIGSVGPQPAEFAWLSLGSQGRREAAPSSDIDSGIVWAGEADQEHERYMHKVAEQVLGTLTATGWESDAHGVTASGALAAQSAGDFRRSLERWLDHPDDNKVVMAISIVLDSRVVQGPADVFGALAPLMDAGRHKRVLRLLLRLALVDKPPTGFLKNIVVESSGEHRGHFDIKRGGLLPIVDIGRYAAVAAGVTVTPTLERLRSAAAAGTLRENEATTLEEAFDLFSALRLEHQVQQLEAGTNPDNHIDPKALNPLTRRYLKDAFRAVASVQKTLASELTWKQ